MLMRPRKIKTRKGRNKIGVVLREFKGGRLRSSSGQPVKALDQALAIAMSEARKAEKGGPFKLRTFKGRRRMRPVLMGRRRRSR